MCGIAGVVRWDGAGEPGRSAELAASMVGALGHRGPDGRGVVSCTESPATGGRHPSVALGHTRLAILDLSERAAQPMQLASSPVWITFNGEIFNFREVRAELEARGRVFRTASDTEVVLQGYDEWGAAVLPRLQGMFAFAIWDGRRAELFLVRDRLGIKPLYIYEADDTVLFASEIRSLLATNVVSRRLDPVALEQYLAYQTALTPRTLVEGIRMIPAGHYRLISRGERTERCYWDLLDNASTEAETADPREVRGRVRQLLDESAARHLVSDVPVGIFLSGGIDSSALVALVRKAGTTPRTFSVVLPGTRHDEASFARKVAERFDADHSEILVEEPDLTDGIADALASVDHPSGDGINTFVISRAVRQAGVKVALSGLGGDELFGGYPSFGRMGRLARYARAWKRSPEAVRSAAATAVRVLGRSSIASAKAAAVLEGDGTLPQAFPVMRQLFSRRERRELLAGVPSTTVGSKEDPYVTLLEDAVAKHPEAGLMSLVSYAEVHTYMHDVLLRDTDQMSMAHGLEVRVPLLDSRLAEHVMGLSDAVKQSGTTPKPLLVQSLGGALPPECVSRPKQGFVLPLDLWMQGRLRPFCEHHLGPNGLGGRDVVSPSAVHSLWNAYLSGNRRTNWSRPWTLVALNAWLEQNGIRR